MNDTFSYYVRRCLVMHNISKKFNFVHFPGILTTRIFHVINEKIVFRNAKAHSFPYNQLLIKIIVLINKKSIRWCFLWLKNINFKYMFIGTLKCQNHLKSTKHCDVAKQICTRRFYYIFINCTFSFKISQYFHMHIFCDFF